MDGMWLWYNSDILELFGSFGIPILCVGVTLGCIGSENVWSQPKPLIQLTSVHVLMSSILLAPCLRGCCNRWPKKTDSKLLWCHITGSGWMFVSAGKRIQMITIAWVQFPVRKACVCPGHRNLLPARPATTEHYPQQREQKAKSVLKKQHVRNGIAHSTVFRMIAVPVLATDFCSFNDPHKGTSLGSCSAFCCSDSCLQRFSEVPPVRLSWQKLVNGSLRGYAAEKKNNEMDGFGKKKNRSCQIQQVSQE